MTCASYPSPLPVIPACSQRESIFNTGCPTKTFGYDMWLLSESSACHPRRRESTAKPGYHGKFIQLSFLIGDNLDYSFEIFREIYDRPPIQGDDILGMCQVVAQFFQILDRLVPLAARLEADPLP